MSVKLLVHATEDSPTAVPD